MEEIVNENINENIVELKNIIIDYKMKKYTIRAVNDVNLNIKRDRITAIVGESGSGKTTIASALLNCISRPGEVSGGEVMFYGYNQPLDIIKLDNNAINTFRWKEISMVFQGAQSSLNPIFNIFTQFYETMQVHDKNITKEEAIEKSRYYLEFVNLNPKLVMESYPHELSGGMKQRVLIAFSLLLDPKLVILDEPTTALDVITQDFIFKLLHKINREMGTSMLLLTHDIAVVAKYADYMGVMYGGKLMEYGIVEDVFTNKYHPYSAGLIAATPSLYKSVEDMHPITGTPPNLLEMPNGCVFHPRCGSCMEVCRRTEPEIIQIKKEHYVKCHLFSNKKGDE